jgi:hypothetical protein
MTLYNGYFKDGIIPHIIPFQQTTAGPLFYGKDGVFANDSYYMMIDCLAPNVATLG